MAAKPRWQAMQFQHSLVNLWVSYVGETAVSRPMPQVSAFSGESLGELPRRALVIDRAASKFQHSLVNLWVSYHIGAGDQLRGNFSFSILW